MKKFIFLVISCFALNAFASTSYTMDKVKLMNAKGEILAEITKGTEVKVLKKEGNKTFVELKGWSYEEEPNLEIFPAVGITVTLALTSEAQVKNRKITQKKADEYEDMWVESKVSGWLLTSQLSNDFSSLWINEAKFASERCGTCHGAPKIEAYEAVQFPSLISLMRSQSGITPDEETSIVNYYQKNKIYGKK